MLPVTALPPPSAAPSADEEASVSTAQSDQPVGPPAMLSSAGSEDAFVMVEDDPDAFESALEAALNDTDGGLNAAMPGDGEGDIGEWIDMDCASATFLFLAHVTSCGACPQSFGWPCRRRATAAHRSGARTDGLTAVNAKMYFYGVVLVRMSGQGD